MRFIRRLLAAAGVRAHPAHQDPKQPTDDPDQTTGARRPTRRWWARTAVGVTAIAMLVLATAAPALAAGDPAAAAAANTGHVYWGNANLSGLSGTIGRANLTGTMATQSFIPGAVQPFAAPGVAVDAAHVYWTDDMAGTIGRANLDGTAVNQSFITGASNPFGVAVDGAHVYWTNLIAFSPQTGAQISTIGRANLDGRAVNQKFITSPSQATGVAVDHTATR